MQDFSDLKNLLAGIKQDRKNSSDEIMSVDSTLQAPEPVLAAENEQINDSAKSPNQQTKEERVEEVIKQEASRSPAGQMMKDQSIANTPSTNPTEQQLLQLKQKYKEVMEGGKKDPSSGAMLADALAGAHNIINYAQGGHFSNMKLDNVSRENAANKKSKEEELSNIQNLQNMYQKYMDMQNKGKMSEYQKAMLENKEKDRDLKRKIAELKKGSEEESPLYAKLSKGEEQVDKDFGKKYNTWNTDGRADYDVNKKIFSDAISDLKNEDVDTGFLSGLGSRVPGVRTDTRETEDKVRKAINGMLRATLGAQFTEKEGERIFQQTFDPFASPESNIERMELELAKLEKRKEAMDDMGEYFRKNKTLSGYEAKPLSETQYTSDEKKAPAGEIVERNGKQYKWNPRKGKYQLM